MSNKPKNLGELWKRADELTLLIAAYQQELKEVEDRINQIQGLTKTTYDRVYDDENPDYIRQSQEEI